MSLREYSEEDMQQELLRRERLRDTDWPRKIVVKFEPEDECDVIEALEEYCNFLEGSEQSIKILDSIKSALLVVEVSEDASSTILASDPAEPEPESVEEVTEEVAGPLESLVPIETKLS